MTDNRPDSVRDCRTCAYCVTPEYRCLKSPVPAHPILGACSWQTSEHPGAVCGASRAMWVTRSAPIEDEHGNALHPVKVWRTQADIVTAARAALLGGIHHRWSSIDAECYAAAVSHGWDIDLDAVVASVDASYGRDGAVDGSVPK